MNIYCFSTLSFAKLQFKSVINKAFHKHGVASFTDAWIETPHCSIRYFVYESHLLQMRGLKPFEKIYIGCSTTVASFTDAWIETMRRHYIDVLRGSHLLQMRGLKRRLTILTNMLIFVASFTDAWIETPSEALQVKDR